MTSAADAHRDVSSCVVHIEVAAVARHVRQRRLPARPCPPGSPRRARHARRTRFAAASAVEPRRTTPGRMARVVEDIVKGVPETSGETHDRGPFCESSTSRKWRLVGVVDKAGTGNLVAGDEGGLWVPGGGELEYRGTERARLARTAPPRQLPVRQRTGTRSPGPARRACQLPRRCAARRTGRTPRRRCRWGDASRHAQRSTGPSSASPAPLPLVVRTSLMSQLVGNARSQRIQDAPSSICSWEGRKPGAAHGIQLSGSTPTNLRT